MEDEETFEVRLTNPSAGMSVLEGSATITILNNERGYDAPAFLSARESQEFLEFRVYREGDFETESSIDVVTESDNAIAGVDYVASTNRLQFAPGQKFATARITLLNDASADGTKFLNLRLTNALGGIPAPDHRPIIEIEDNETGFSLGVGAIIVEGAGSVLNVYRIGDYQTTSRVRVSLMQEADGQTGSATPGADYNEFATIVVFSPGETNVALQVPVLDDHVSEHDKTIFVLLESFSV